jgi:hypothetical protein
MSSEVFPSSLTHAVCDFLIVSEVLFLSFFLSRSVDIINLIALYTWELFQYGFGINSFDMSSFV